MADVRPSPADIASVRAEVFLKMLISPYGGTLVDLVVDPARAMSLRADPGHRATWVLSARQACDLELLALGGFSPLRGFLGRSDYESVCSSMTLADGTLWPIPIVLDIDADAAGRLSPGSDLELLDTEGYLLAVLHVRELWQRDLAAEALAVFGTSSLEHPGVSTLLHSGHAFVASGHLEVLRLPAHHDFVDLRLTPAQTRARFEALGWSRVLAFQTRNPMHRAHLELTLRGMADSGANLLVHPVVGVTREGDVDYYSRVRCYRLLMPRYSRGTALLSLLPLAMRMAGPREAVWHAIIRRNYGCSHFIVGRDHAGPGRDSTGRWFYEPLEAQDLVRRHLPELGMTMVPFRDMVYVPTAGQCLPEDEVPSGVETSQFSGTEFRRRLAHDLPIPGWFTFPEVLEELRRTYPPRSRQGVTVFFTGLSGSGKSTIAKILCTLLHAEGRRVTMLDGDEVRQHLSAGLGFSREGRVANIRRIGYVAAEITRHGGTVICAAIAPYEATRREVQERVSALGGFVLVHVSTRLEVCEQRDGKGLYAKARAGVLKEFTGISDPYERPQAPSLVVDTEQLAPHEAAARIVDHLRTEGYLRTPERDASVEERE
jgi:sulfate adenylyltransferase